MGMPKGSDVVQSAMKALNQEGIRVPIYRSNEWRINAQIEEKEGKKKSWYKRGSFSSVIFVPATPESTLKKALDKDVKESGLKIKAGVNIKRILQRIKPI